MPDGELRRIHLGRVSALVEPADHHYPGLRGAPLAVGPAELHPALRHASAWRRGHPFLGLAARAAADGCARGVDSAARPGQGAPARACCARSFPGGSEYTAAAWLVLLAALAARPLGYAHQLRHSGVHAPDRMARNALRVDLADQAESAGFE